MAKAKVYFYKNVNDYKTGFDKVLKLIAEDLKPEGKTAIKIHFGANNNDTHINPKYLVDLPKYIHDPIFVESNCLYPGMRHRSDKHIKLAREHGFTYLDIDILDGELGRDYNEIEINSRNAKVAKISSGLQRYKNLIAISHFKGTPGHGFGGAIKNLAMGLASRAGKMHMHSGVAPNINEEKCNSCGECVENCIANAIALEEFAVIDQELCIGCAFCISVCPERAIGASWGKRKGKEFIELLADYAFAVTRDKNWWYINAIINITEKCDCMPFKQEPFMDDIGMLFSKDPIAIDQASIDLVMKHNNGVDPFKKPDVPTNYILKYGEELGLGTTEYELIELE
ncbi:MAG: DUF362 domain-containing protein [Candidatus Heimdallarchaeota archaeon]